MNDLLLPGGYRPKVVITLGSNYFKLKNPDDDVKKLIMQFVRQFIKLNYMVKDKLTGKPQQTVFAAALRSRTEFRFHINTYERFIKLLENNGIKENVYLVKKEADYTPESIQIKMKEGWSPRDYQVPIIDYLNNPGKYPQDNKFVGLSMGMGKTYLATTAICHYQQRTILILKPGYIPKWVEDFKKMTDIPVKTIMTVSGSDALKAFLTLCKEDKLGDIRIVMISNKTYQNWLKAYEEFGDGIKDMGYDAAPDELFPLAKAGVRLIDEVHQDFHLCFKTDLYTHCPLRISLSATLDHYDPFMKEMYEIAYPSRSRADVPSPKAFIDTIGVSYYVEPNRKLVTTEYGQSHYSHNAYEKCIMRDKGFLRNYLEMIRKMVDNYYIKRRQSGQKAIIFASTIKMCDYIVDYLRKAYPELDIRRFCEKDPYSNLIDADIRVSNMIKAGTGHDIPQLITNIMTIAIDSLQSNLQLFGRLREIPNVDTEFLYLTCQDIDKHVRYDMNKRELLKSRSKSQMFIQYPHRL